MGRIGCQDIHSILGVFVCVSKFVLGVEGGGGATKRSLKSDTEGGERLTTHDCLAPDIFTCCEENLKVYLLILRHGNVSKRTFIVKGDRSPCRPKFCCDLIRKFRISERAGGQLQ